MVAKEYLKQAYLLNKQIRVEMQELDQLREMRDIIQNCSYGERIGSNPNKNVEAPFIKTIEKIIELEERINDQIESLVNLQKGIDKAIENMENPKERLLLKYRYIKGMN